MIKKAFFFLSIALLLAGCKGENKQTSSTPKKDGQTTEVKKQIIKKKLPIIKPFSYITSLSGMNIVFRQGDYDIEAEGDSALINYLVTDFDSQILTLSMRGEENVDMNVLESNVNITVYVSSPDLNCISMCGSGTFKQIGTLRTDNFQMGLMGKGTIDCDTIITPAFRLEVSQPGKAKFKHINSADMLIYNRSAATITADVDAGLLNVVNTTSGSVTLSGRAKEKNVSSSPKGKVECQWDYFVSKH